MRHGIVVAYGSPAQLAEAAQEAEAHGWDAFFTWDGIGIGPMDTWDPWTVLAAAAVRTTSIRLGAMIFALARRRPWKVAREALTVDHLSGGRLVLPVGLGVDEDGGFSRVSGEGRTARERAERLDECLAILDRASTGRPFSFSGRHHTVTDLQIAPPPVQRPRVPVWPVAAWPAERSLARAARWDGAVLQGLGSHGPLSPDDVAACVARLAELRGADVGDGSAYDVVMQGESPDDPAAARDHLAALTEAGATWWVESRWDPERDGYAATLARIRRGPPR